MFNLRIARVKNNLNCRCNIRRYKNNKYVAYSKCITFIVGFAGGQEVSVFVGWRSYYSLFIFMLDVSVSIMRRSRGE